MEFFLYLALYTVFASVALMFVSFASEFFGIVTVNRNTKGKFCKPYRKLVIK